MTAFFVLLGVTYGVGVFVAITAVKIRAGVPVMATIFPWDVGWVWFFMTFATTMLWPVTLVLWLKAGRPEPTVVFGDKARERVRNQAAELTALRGTVSQDGRWIWDGRSWVANEPARGNAGTPGTLN